MKVENNNLQKAENQKFKLEIGFSFIKQTLINNWRSLLLILIGVYLPLQLFEILAVKVWDNGTGFPWDVPILLAIHQTAQPQLDTLAVILTNIGSPKVALPVSSVIGLVLLLKKQWRLSAYLFITATGSTIINIFAKGFMHRIRPHLWESAMHKSSYAFPSGHAMTSMTTIAILLVLAWKTPWRLPVLILGSLFILTIGWTRLYLGVHFPSDILAGWMVAFAWAVGVYIVINPNKKT